MAGESKEAQESRHVATLRRTATSNPTSSYVPSGSGAGWGWGMAALDGKPFYSWYDIPRMIRDPRVRFLERMWRSPFQQVTWTIKATHPAVQTYVDHQLRRFWRESLPALLSRYFWFGFAPGGAEFARRRGLVRLDGVRPLEPFDARPLMFSEGCNKGRMAGLTFQSTKVYLPHAFWFAGEKRFGPFYDMPPAGGMFEPWAEKRGRNGAIDMRRTWFRKNAGRGVVVRHPPGRTEASDDFPSGRDNQSLAREMLDYSETNSSFTFTNELHQGDPTKYAWDVQFPESFPDRAGFREYPKDLDAEMAEGVGIPREVLEAATTGSGYSGRQIPLQAWLGGVDEYVGMLLRACEWLKWAVMINFGPSAYFEVEPESLVKKLLDDAKGPGGMGGAVQNMVNPPKDSSGGGIPPGMIPYKGKRGGTGYEDPNTGKHRYLSDGRFDHLTKRVQKILRRKEREQRAILELSDGRTQPDPKARRNTLLILLAMVDFQRRAHAVGDRDSSQPYLAELSKLLANPGAMQYPLQLSWRADETKTGHIKAVGEAEHAGRILYGARAEAALRAQEGLKAGLKPGERRTPTPTPHPNRDQWQKAGQRAREILAKVANETHSADDLTELAQHLPYLPVDRLGTARSILRFKLKAARGRLAQVDALMDHIRDKVGVLDQKPAEELPKEEGDWKDKARKNGTPEDEIQLREKHLAQFHKDRQEMFDRHHAALKGLSQKDSYKLLDKHKKEHAALFDTADMRHSKELAELRAKRPQEPPKKPEDSASLAINKDAPQVASMQKNGKPKKLTAIGRSLKGEPTSQEVVVQQYYFPGLESMPLGVQEPGGDKSKGTKRGYRIFDTSTGVLLEQGRAAMGNLEHESLQEVVGRLRGRVARDGGVEPVMQKAVDFAAKHASDHKPAEQPAVPQDPPGPEDSAPAPKAEADDVPGFAEGGNLFDKSQFDTDDRPEAVQGLHTILGHAKQFVPNISEPTSKHAEKLQKYTAEAKRYDAKAKELEDRKKSGSVAFTKRDHGRLTDYQRWADDARENASKLASGAAEVDDYLDQLVAVDKHAGEDEDEGFFGKLSANFRGNAEELADIDVETHAEAQEHVNEILDQAKRDFGRIDRTRKDIIQDLTLKGKTDLAEFYSRHAKEAARLAVAEIGRKAQEVLGSHKKRDDEAAAKAKAEDEAEEARNNAPNQPELRNGAVQPSRKETYINGDRAEFTGNTHENGMHEYEFMEGHRKGEKGHTARGADGSDPYAERGKKEWADQQADFKKLDTQEKPKLHAMAQEQFDSHLPIMKQQVDREVTPRKKLAAAIRTMDGLTPDAQKALADKLAEIAPDAHQYARENGGVPLDMRKHFEKAEKKPVPNPYQAGGPSDGAKKMLKDAESSHPGMIPVVREGDHWHMHPDNHEKASKVGVPGSFHKDDLESNLGKLLKGKHRVAVLEPSDTPAESKPSKPAASGTHPALAHLDPVKHAREAAHVEAGEDALLEKARLAENAMHAAKEAHRTVGSRQPEKRNALKALNAATKAHEEAVNEVSKYNRHDANFTARLNGVAVDEKQPLFVRIAAAHKASRDKGNTNEIILPHVKQYLEENGHDPRVADAVAGDATQFPMRSAKKLKEVIQGEETRQKMYDERKEAREHIKGLDLLPHHASEAEREAGNLYQGDIKRFKEKWGGIAVSTKDEQQRQAENKKKYEEQHAKDNAAKSAADAYLAAHRDGKPLPSLDPDAMHHVIQNATTSHQRWHAGSELPKADNGKQIVEDVAKQNGKFAFSKMIATEGWATDAKFLMKATPEMVEYAKSKDYDKLEGRVPPHKDIIAMGEKNSTRPAKLVANRKADSGEPQILAQAEDGRTATMSGQYVANILKVYPGAEVFIHDSHGPVLFKKDGKTIGLVMPLSPGGKEDSFDTFDPNERLKVSDVAEPGPYKPEHAEEWTNGKIVVGRGASQMRLDVSKSGDGYAVSSTKRGGPEYGRYGSRSEAIAAARELLGHAHGMAEDGGLVFKPKGEKGEGLPQEEQARLDYYAGVKEKVKAIKGKPKKTTFGDTEKEVHPATEHFGVAKGKTGGWETLHLPSGLSIGDWSRKEDAIGHAIATQEIPGADWSDKFADTTDEAVKAKRKDVFDRARAVRKAFEDNDLPDHAKPTDPPDDEPGAGEAATLKPSQGPSPTSATSPAMAPKPGEQQTFAGWMPGASTPRNPAPAAKPEPTAEGTEARRLSGQAKKATDSHSQLKPVGTLPVKPGAWKERSDIAHSLGSVAQTAEQHQSAANAHSRAADEHADAARRARTIPAGQEHEEARRMHSAAAQKHVRAVKSLSHPELAAAGSGSKPPAPPAAPASAAEPGEEDGNDSPLSSGPAPEVNDTTRELEKHRIEDFGEKIGGARKDTATPLGPRSSAMSKPKDERPGWARRYHVGQDAKTGRWFLNDQKKKGYGGLIKGDYATKEEAEAMVPLIEVARNHRVHEESRPKTPADAAYAESSSKAADEWLAGVVRDTEALKKEHGDKLLKLHSTNRFKTALSYGEVTQAQFDAARANGTILSDEDHAKAKEVQAQIDAIKNRPIPAGSAPEPKNTYAIHRVIGDRKRPVVKGGFASRDEAMKYMAKNPEEIIGHEFNFPSEVPHLEHIQRTGAEKRKGNIAPKDFQQAFGFRGGEFGKWNQGEHGQAALNHAYDALHDLADVIGADPKAISLNGNLAIAFGARGTGGENAARAHYERDKAVINLTKIKGAGTLAHEWFHALDHHIGKLMGKNGTDREGSYASHGAPYNSKARKELTDAFKGVMDTIHAKTVDEPIREDHAEKSMGHLKEAIASDLADIATRLRGEQQYNKRFKPFTPEQQAEWNGLLDKLKTGDFGKKVFVEGTGKQKNVFGGYESFETIQSVNALYKKATGRSFITAEPQSSGRRIISHIKSVQDAAKRVEQAKGGASEQRKRGTDYLHEAKKIDSHRLTDYWSSRHELAARAFESYVNDKISAGGKRSDYLTYGSKNHAMNSGLGKPYPEGDERIAINAAFDRLLAAIEDAELSGKKKPGA